MKPHPNAEARRVSSNQSQLCQTTDWLSLEGTSGVTLSNPCSSRASYKLRDISCDGEPPQLPGQPVLLLSVVFVVGATAVR